MEPHTTRSPNGPAPTHPPSSPFRSAFKLRNRPSSVDIQRRSHRSEEEFEMMLQRALSSPTVQSVLPDLQSFEETEGFKSYFITCPVDTEPRKVRDIFLHFAENLDRHERKADIWKQGYKHQLLTLKKLLHNFDEKSRHVAHESLIGLGIHSIEDRDINLSKDYRNARAERDLGLTGFEDLYYLLACKARGLYADLQIRYASGFITLDTVLYKEKDRNSELNHTPRAPCTVKYLRNMLRALWFNLLHPQIIRTLETAINKRKYQHLKAHPLVPTLENDEDDEDDAKYEKYKIGSNLDAPTLSVMFQHLEDVSTVPIPQLLHKIDLRTRVCQVPLVPIEAPRSNVEQSRVKVASWEDSWIDLRKDEENYIEQEIERAESVAEYYEHEDRQTVTRVVQLAPRTTSLMPTATVTPSPRTKRFYNEAGSPATAVKVRQWLPEAVQLDTTYSQALGSNVLSPISLVSPMSRIARSDVTSSHTTPPVSPMSKTSHSDDSRITATSPSSKYSRSNASHKAHTAVTPSTKFSHSVPPTTPSTAIRTQSITDSPSSRRLPFHGNNEYLPPPPFLPPKSPEQIAAAAQAARAKQLRERQMRNENERLKRENSRLHEALQQVQAHGRLQRENPQLREALQQVQAHERVQRENSQLQENLQQVHGHDQKMKREQSGLREAFQQIQYSPGGLMRRLSKAGSRARSRSPFKPSRRRLSNPKCRDVNI